MDAVDLIKNLPYSSWKRAIRWFRKRFPREWPEDRPTIVVDISHDEFEGRLYNNHWERTPYSLKYTDEVVNMRKPYSHHKGAEKEIHTRSRDHPKGIEIEVHEEYSRYTEKENHLRVSVDSLEQDTALYVLPIEKSELA